MSDPSGDNVIDDDKILRISDYAELLRAELAIALSSCQNQLTRRFEIDLRGSAICVFLQDLGFGYVWVHNPPTRFSVDDLVERTDEDFLEVDKHARFHALKNGGQIEVEFRPYGLRVGISIATRRLAAT